MARVGRLTLFAAIAAAFAAILGVQAFVPAVPTSQLRRRCPAVVLGRSPKTFQAPRSTSLPRPALPTLLAAGGAAALLLRQVVQRLGSNDSALRDLISRHTNILIVDDFTNSESVESPVLPEPRCRANSADDLHWYVAPNGDGLPPVRWILKKPSALQRVLLEGGLGFAESYMDGDWDTNDLERLVFEMLKLENVRSELGWRVMPLLSMIFWGALKWKILPGNSLKGAQSNIANTYDVLNSPKLYEIMLGPTMHYNLLMESRPPGAWLKGCRSPVPEVVAMAASGSNGAPSSSGGYNSTQTATEVESQPSSSSNGPLHLVLEPRPQHNVSWDASVVDNEHMNKKKSKKCCIFSKPRAFGESSSESEGSDSPPGLQEQLVLVPEPIEPDTGAPPSLIMVVTVLFLVQRSALTATNQAAVARTTPRAQQEVAQVPERLLERTRRHKGLRLRALAGRKEKHVLPTLELSISMPRSPGATKAQKFLAKQEYTCAYYPRPDMSLDEAQEAKMDLIAKKLDLKPGMRCLEFGFGFGAQAHYLASKYGVHVTGVTLSREQMAWEHVGRNSYETFFDKCYELLKDDGIMLIHTMGWSRRGPWNHNAFVNKYIFPGGEMPTMSHMTMEYSDRWHMEDWQSFGKSYVMTLRCWLERIRDWKGLDELDNRFRRMWVYYLCACAAAFERRRVCPGGGSTAPDRMTASTSAMKRAQRWLRALPPEDREFLFFK
ncbi:Cyclopropane-fatty-acyl-phospholipid synthase [Symbiodinium microadriaticum]|uniref:Cyclopropane-fatty-acyl-phospholipid synthase n=1 Tax=Symbiodinium microadriaticum TaxID=2951 RepID=A0A1Q9CSF7_SYMMI|nr:Cyclopropane-fatty-acyl-phospholipid synthase [Symbiodinium microadriaticum]